MPEWKILLTDGLDMGGQEILRAGAQVDDQKDISGEALLEVVGEYDAVIVRGRTRMTAQVIAAAKRLKVIGRAGVGVDNIDLAAAQAHRVTVVNAPKSTSISVAELTLGLMFAVARNIPRADAALKAGKWLKKELAGVELNGKTLGIIGTGNIGSAVAQRAAALGMTPLGFDPLVPEVEIRTRGIEPVSLTDLFARSDFITVHVPLTDQTRGLINTDTLAQMKPGVCIFCAARGGVVDETALLAALNNGRVAAAGLDVFAQEPPLPDDPLILHPHVVATPHIGAQTAEAQLHASEDVATEVLAALRGEILRWKIV